VFGLFSLYTSRLKKTKKKREGVSGDHNFPYWDESVVLGNGGFDDLIIYQEISFEGQPKPKAEADEENKFENEPPKVSSLFSSYNRQSSNRCQ
jgi:hypothetical protein